MFFEHIKKISKHYVIYAAGSFISRAIGFVMLPVYTRFLLPADYGILEILNLTVWILGLVAGMNISTGVLRFYYAYDNDKERNSVISSSIFFTIFFSFIFIISLICFSNSFSRILFNNTHYSLFVKLTFAALFFDLITVIPLACFRIKNKSLTFISFTLLQLFIGLFINIALIVVLKWGVLGVLCSQLLTPLIMSPVLLYITFKEFGHTLSFDPLKKIIVYSLPLIPASLAMIILNFGDRYILKSFVSLTEVGLYVFSYKIVIMILGFLAGLPFTYIWQPYSFSIAENENAPKIYSRIFTYFTLFVSFLALCLAVLAKDIIKIMAPPTYFGAVKVIPPVALGIMFYQLYYLLILGILLKKKTKWLTYIVSAAACLNVAMNFVLIPRMGMMAAAYTTLLSFAFLAVLGYFASQKIYRIPYELNRLSKIIFAGIGLYFISEFIKFDSLVTDIFIKLIVIISFPLILYMLGFYAPEEINKVSYLTRSFKATLKEISLRILGVAQS